MALQQPLLPIISSLVLLRLLHLGLAVGPNDPSAWLWPYSNSPFVVATANDGLPDFNRTQKFTNTTISCPSALTKECCVGTHHKEEKSSCCEDKSANRFCDGGYYCRATVHHIKTVKDGRTEFMPHYAHTAPHEIDVNRTRRNILQRAIGWLAVNTAYIGCHVSDYKYNTLETCAADDPPECPQYAFTGTCEGLTMMAFGAKHYAGQKDSTSINCKSLKPGDAAAHFRTVGTYNHVWMFRSWVDKPGGHMRIYQMGGGHGSSNMRPSMKYKFCTKKGQTECVKCWRYKHIVDEDGQPEEGEDEEETTTFWNFHDEDFVGFDDSVYFTNN